MTLIYFRARTEEVMGFEGSRTGLLFNPVLRMAIYLVARGYLRTDPALLLRPVPIGQEPPELAFEERSWAALKTGSCK